MLEIPINPTAMTVKRIINDSVITSAKPRDGLALLRFRDRRKGSGCLGFMGLIRDSGEEIRVNAIGY
jgi:hypothetical protein